ncbi:MAG: putative F0F1-ATPase [bacterium ADurb.Bin478]|nr:MAG: putative F0F1-ATPase [bacterium ADurb.Bin478]
MKTKWNMRSYGRFLDLGLQLAVGFGLGFAGGWWLDGKLHTTPVLSLLGLMLGAAGGFLNIYRAVYPVHDRTKDGNKN